MNTSSVKVHFTFCLLSVCQSSVQSHRLLFARTIAWSMGMHWCSCSVSKNGMNTPINIY